MLAPPSRVMSRFSRATGAVGLPSAVAPATSNLASSSSDASFARGMMRRAAVSQSEFRPPYQHQDAHLACSSSGASNRDAAHAVGRHPSPGFPLNTDDAMTMPRTVRPEANNNATALARLEHEHERVVEVDPPFREETCVPIRSRPTVHRSLGGNRRDW